MRGGSKEVVFSETMFLQLQGWIYVSNIDCSTEMIIEEVRSLLYFIHADGVEIYCDSRKQYEWQRVKKDIIRYVSWCLIISRSRMSSKDRVAYFRKWLYTYLK